MGTGSNDLNSRDLPANYTPSNYTPDQVASEGTDKVSAHLKGIDNFLSPTVSIINDEFLSSATPAMSLGWSTTISGGANLSKVTTGIDSTDQALGEVQIATTGNGTRIALSLGVDQMLLGYAQIYQEWRMNILTLSDGTNAFHVNFGLYDNTGAGLDCTDGVHFQYDPATSTNWRCVTVSNGTATKTTTSVAVSTTYTRFGIAINSTGTSVTFTINGTSVATHTTNIPTGAGRFTGVCSKIQKTGGAAARQAVIDYFYQRITR